MERLPPLDRAVAGGGLGARLKQFNLALGQHLRGAIENVAPASLVAGKAHCEFLIAMTAMFEPSTDGNL